MRTRRLAFSLAFTIVTGCGLLNGDDEQEVTLWIGPMTSTCFGPFERQCMLVKEAEDAEYELFYDNIQGFTFEAGYSYVLRASWKTIPNPPQDGPSRSWRLIEIESKVPSPR